MTYEFQAENSDPAALDNLVQCVTHCFQDLATMTSHSSRRHLGSAFLVLGPFLKVVDRSNSVRTVEAGLIFVRNLIGSLPFQTQYMLDSGDVGRVLQIVVRFLQLTRLSCSADSWHHRCKMAHGMVSNLKYGEISVATFRNRDVLRLIHVVLGIPYLDLALD